MTAATKAVKDLVPHQTATFFSGFEPLGKGMPICPKCGKPISDKKYGRHLRRCGTRHKFPARPLDHPENFYMKV